tara:strand:+ start:113 stop:232 length:120 start_codon:yes stop_codon:yes gene_type:complete
MIRNGLTFIVILTAIVAIGIASLGAYVYMNEVISSYFIS